jgi:hypothetical protein
MKLPRANEPFFNEIGLDDSGEKRLKEDVELFKNIDSLFKADILHYEFAWLQSGYYMTIEEAEEVKKELAEKMPHFPVNIYPNRFAPDFGWLDIFKKPRGNNEN